MDEILYQDLTGRIIGVCLEVHHELGHGFLESVYENALVIALRDSGLKVERQVRFDVRFRNQNVGDFVADLLVDNTVIVEIKAAGQLRPEHEAQVLNYLKATRIRVGLLVNFGKPKMEIKRFIF